MPFERNPGGAAAAERIAMIPRRKLHSRLLGSFTLLAGVLAAFVITPSVARATTAPGIQFMEFNYAGVHKNAGVYNNAIVPKINSFQPGVLMLEEICFSQYVALLSDPTLTWQFQGQQFIPKKDTTDESPRCAPTLSGQLVRLGTRS